MLLLRDLLLSSSEINIFDSFEKFVRDSNGTDNSYPVSKKILGIVWASVSISAGFLLVLGNAYLNTDTIINTNININNSDSMQCYV